MRVNYYIYAGDEKAGSGIGEGFTLREPAGSMYPHEDSRIFFEVGS